MFCHYQIEICCRDVNLFRHLMKVPVDMSLTMSKCTALTTRQVNKQIHAFVVLIRQSVWMINGPAKSTPVKLNAGASLTRITGK